MQTQKVLRGEDPKAVINSPHLIPKNYGVTLTPAVVKHVVNSFEKVDSSLQSTIVILWKSGENHVVNTVYKNNFLLAFL